MFDKSNQAPAPPDYSGIINAQMKLGKEALKLQKEQQEWARNAYAEDKAVTDKVVASFLDSQEQTKQWAIADRARYEEIFQPLEEDLAREAREYASPERKDLEMGRSQAAVGQQFDSARQSSMRQLESFGINPGATRYGALDIGMRAQEAATKAAAGNQASQTVDATGRALRSEAINVGRGYPGQIAGTYGISSNAGTGAVNSSLADTASGANTMGTGVQWGGVANNAYGGAAQTQNMGYTNALNQAKINNESSSGFGALAGLGASMFLGGTKPWIFAEDGGAIPTPERPGGAIPVAASPSRGRAPDDVDAKVTAGEFIIPRETVEWLGQKHFHQLISKSREDKVKSQQQSGAIPTMKRAQPNGAQGAIPIAA
jgi:hypothetical protein